MKDKILTYNEYFRNELVVIMWIIVVLGIMGNVLDMIMFTGYPAQFNKLNAGAIVIFSLVPAVHRFFRVDASKLILVCVYVIAANSVFSQLWSHVNADTPAWFFRESIFISLLLIIAIIVGGAVHGLIIDLIYVVMAVVRTYESGSVIIRDNLPITLIVFVCFSFVMIYVIRKLRDAIQTLQERNHTISKQKGQIEDSFARLDEAQKRLEKQYADLKEMSEAVTKNNMLLEDANGKLREFNSVKDMIFSVIAHDLKGAAFVVGISIESILRDYYQMDDNVRRKNLFRSFRGIESLHMLLDNLLLWGRAQTGQLDLVKERINVHEAVENVIRQLGAQINDKKISLVVDISDDLEVECDSMMFDAIIRNIISNAVKYSHAGGEVTVNSVKGDGMALTMIRDNGTGISADRMKTLFGTGIRKPLPGTVGEKGTGLGLTICGDFVKRNGGFLRVESEQEKGSVFTVELPLSNESK
jgi:signal transduction histidine kinase